MNSPQKGSKAFSPPSSLTLVSSLHFPCLAPPHTHTFIVSILSPAPTFLHYTTCKVRFAFKPLQFPSTLRFLNVSEIRSSLFVSAVRGATWVDMWLLQFWFICCWCYHYTDFFTWLHITWKTSHYYLHPWLHLWINVTAREKRIYNLQERLKEEKKLSYLLKVTETEIDSATQ